MQMSAMVILSIAVWTVLGLLAYGLSFAYWQREFPTLAKRDRAADKRKSLILALAGPVGLVVILIYSGDGKHGVKFN